MPHPTSHTSIDAFARRFRGSSCTIKSRRLEQEMPQAVVRNMVVRQWDWC